MTEIDENSNSLYKLIVENSFDIITLVDLQGIIKFVTPSIELHLGYSPEELTGSNVFSLVHPKDQELATQAIDRIFKNVAKGANLVLRFQHKNRRWRYIEIAGKLIETLAFKGVLLHTRDITAKQENINELIHSEESFQAAFNASSTLSAISMPSTGKHINVNDAWLKTLGWRRAEVIGNTAKNMNVWGSQENRAHILGALAERGKLRQFRAALYTRTGERRSVLVDAEYLELKIGTVVYFSSIDVTERDQFEEQLRQSQKFEALGRLTGGIAHDFNNLLGVIMGNAELALLDLKESLDVTESLTGILKASKNGASLIQQLLSFSSKQKLSPASFNLGFSIERLLPLISTSLGKDIELSIDAEDSDWMCRIDSTQLENAILNMAINAKDAMPHGGSFWINTKKTLVNAEREKVLGIPQGDYLELEIGDTGTGISDKHITQVFEPFFTTKQERGGSGLGLSMVFGFVKQSGGHVSIESGSHGKGTKFILLLPRGEKEIAQENISDKGTIHRQKRRRVLLVEDNKRLLKLISRMLQSLSFEVVVANDGSEALTKIDPNFDLLLTDVMLPGEIKGPDIVREVISQYPSMMVLYISGFDQGLLATQDLSAKNVDFLHKPFTRDQVANKIAQLFND